MRIEETILRNLIYNDDYTRRVLPFLDNKYFHDFNEKILFEEIAKHISKYNNCPTRETLEISLGGLDTVTEDQFKDLVNSVVEMEIAFSKPTAKDYQFVLFGKDELEEILKINQEDFEKMTELEKEWELFRRAELKEKLDKWIEIKIKLDKKKIE